MNLLEIISENGESTPKELSELTGMSRQYLHRQLNQLTEKGLVRKIGSSPITYYQAAKVEEENKTLGVQLFDSLRQIIEDNFVQITVLGELLMGLDAFTYYCQRKKLPIQDTALSYEMIFKGHQRYKFTHRCIDGTEILQRVMGFGQAHINQLLFLDYDKLEGFGQTRLGYLLHFSKISQHRKLIKHFIALIKPRVEKLIQQLQVEAVAFIPPAEKREFQLMRELAMELSFNLPIVKLIKVQGNIIMPQKMLTNLADRIENARSSIVPVEKRQFRSLLLIDDHVVSGASLNETAAKLKQRNIAKVVYGLGIVGTRKAYE